MSFHTFSVPEDRCVRLLINNLDRQRPEDFVREELETLDICVQGVLQLRSRRHDYEDSKASTLTPHFIASVARGPEVVKLHYLTELCSLRVSVEMYIAPKCPLQCKRHQTSATRSATAITHPSVLFVVRLTSQESALPLHFRASFRPQLALWLVGSQLVFLFTRPMKTEQT